MVLFRCELWIREINCYRWT